MHLLHNDRFKSELLIPSPIASTVSPSPEPPGPLVVVVKGEQLL